MIISVNHSFAFFCMPKCVSHAVEKMLHPCSDLTLGGLPVFRHTTFMEYNKFIEPYLGEKTDVSRIETICLIREPVSWLNSWYRSRSRRALRNPNHHNHKNCTAQLQFTEFSEAYMTPNPPPFAQVRSQFDYIKDGKGSIGVDTLFLYEDIGGLVAYMSRKTGRQLTLSRMNVSPNKRHHSDFAEYIRHRSPKFIRRIMAGRHAINPQVKHEIPDALLRSLRTFMRLDFEMYGSPKTSQAESLAVQDM